MTQRSTAREVGGGMHALVAVLLFVLAVTPLSATDGRKGELTWSWDNTFSYGLLYRLDDPDPALVGLAAGGRAFSVNGDDGDQNYATGIASNAAKWTSELEFSYKSFGGFFRGFAFYDYENESGDRERTELSDDVLRRVGSRAEIRDAFVWYRFGDQRAGELRVGRQVINWGESSFIQGGINSFNPIDVSALRVPGAELREALLPVGAALLSVQLSDNVSMEGFYQLEWQETQIDPVGSYFSATDLAGEGATKVMLGFGSAPDTIPIGVNPSPNPIGVVVPRAATREADDGGQYGAALRVFAPRLAGTEFGFYYLNYHSRVPIISARTGTAAGVLVDRNYVGTAEYFLEYPEDIGLVGLSFNAQLGRSGIALQGEVSRRTDVPLQVDDVELLYAALSPLRLLPPVPALAPLVAVGNLLANTNQIGAFGFDEEISGFRRFDTTQVQLTGTKVFSRVMGSDQFVLVAEAGWSKVHDLPDATDLRLEAPGTYTSGNPVHTLATVQPATEKAGAFPTDTAWGYVLAGRFDYNNAMGAVNLSPRFSFAHDVSGVSPGPGGTFIEGRKALTLGLGFQYQISWEWDLSYTRYFGAGRYNLIHDRDFLAANVKYSF